MTRIAYVDMIGGAAGDMLLAALVDAGADAREIERALRTVAPDGWSVRFERTQRRGIAAARCVLDVAGEDPDFDAAPDHAHDHGHDHEHPHAHVHDAVHDHGTTAVAPVARSLASVLETIERSRLTAAQKERCARIYRRLGEAEAAVHGTSVEAIHFHEVGALDAILDVAGVCVALDLLEVDDVACSAFPIGTGRIRMQHGTYPNPPPATTHLLLGSPVEPLDVPGELVTPTAAAILTTLARDPGRRPSMRFEAVGYGAGRRDPVVPNVVRVVLGSADASADDAPAIAVLEANIDDMSPQHYGLAIERLFAAGARDVWMTPISMKKQRPAIVLSAIARLADEAAVAAVMLSETTTIGVRVRTERKYVLERRIETIDTPLGTVRIKVAGTGDAARMLPEHDDLLRIARERSMPLPEVAKIVQAHADRRDT